MRTHLLILITTLLLLAAGPAGAWSTNEVPCDFVTGGGFIIHNGAHANFGVGGGVKNGAFWGHLEYNDHSTTPPMKVHGTGVTGYFFIDENTRYIQGTCKINGVAGFTYEVKVTDNGEPGRGSDLFSIGLSTGTAPGPGPATGQSREATSSSTRGTARPRLRRGSPVRTPRRLRPPRRLPHRPPRRLRPRRPPRHPPPRPALRMTVCQWSTLERGSPHPTLA